MIRSNVQCTDYSLDATEDRDCDSQDADDERNSENVDAFLKNAAYQIAADTAQPDTPMRAKRSSEDFVTELEDSDSPGGTKRPRLAIDVDRASQLSDVDQREPTPPSASTSGRADAAGTSSSASADSSQDTRPRTGADIAAEACDMLLASPGPAGGGAAQPAHEPREVDGPAAFGAAPLSTVAPAAVPDSVLPRPPSLCSQVCYIYPDWPALLMALMLLPGTQSFVSVHYLLA